MGAAGHPCRRLWPIGALTFLYRKEHMLRRDACAEPKIFNFEWEPFSTEVAGVEVEANLFNVAPCAVLVNARGIKVCAHAVPSAC